MLHLRDQSIFLQPKLHIQILHALGVGLDEPLAGRDKSIPTLRCLGQRLDRITGGEGVSDPLPLFSVQTDQSAAKAQSETAA